MKKALIILALTTGMSTAGNSQNTGKYADLVVYRPYFKNYVAELHIDGNSKKQQTQLKDANGGKMKFATEIDAVNYVSKQGWELVSAYHDRSSTTHFILKK